MNQKKRNAPRSPSEVQADIERAPEQNEAPEVRAARERLAIAQAGTAQRANALQEALDLVQHARDLEARRGRTNGLPEGAFALQRLLIALLETLTPEQRAEVRRRLGA